MSFNINHQHFAECSSTQDILRDRIKKGTYQGRPYELVSTANQTAGHGRASNIWTHFQHNLAFSLALNPHPVVTLTPLEVGVLLCLFFTENYGLNLELKWPNDLHFSGQGKVGGILCEKNEKTVIVGVGINIGGHLLDQHSSFPYQTTALPLEKFNGDFQKDVPLQVYQFLLGHRLDRETVIKLWHEHCVHRETKVKWTENNQEMIGIFKRLGNQGQAIVQVENTLHEIWSGSLSIMGP